MKSSLLLVLQASSGHAMSYLNLIKHASIVVKFVLFLLIIFSVVSWAIIIFKLVEYRNAKTKSYKFLKFFRKTKNFSDIMKLSVNLKDSPLMQIFRTGYKELSIQIGPERDINKINMDSISRSLVRVSNIEITRLERLNGFLATTASVTPFIGLFGTVWGIMTSFQQIGIQMNANLATVAPGIAEALIATALGLFAAIPAVIFYNLLVNKVKVIITEMENFISEFLSASENMR